MRARVRAAAGGCGGSVAGRRGAAAVRAVEREGLTGGLRRAARMKAARASDAAAAAHDGVQSSLYASLTHHSASRECFRFAAPPAPQPWRRPLVALHRPCPPPWRPQQLEGALGTGFKSFLNQRVHLCPVRLVALASALLTARAQKVSHACSDTPAHTAGCTAAKLRHCAGDSPRRR